MKIKKLILSFGACLCVAFASWANVTHVVDRGETLKLIAQKYGVTEAQIIALNPDAAQFVYVGMELEIPVAENAAPASQPAPQQPATSTHWQAANAANDNGYKPVSSSPHEITANDFSSVYLSYYADYEFADKGFYGIGFTSYGENGWGGTISAHGNWGIVDDGSLAFKFGPVYGYPVHPNVMVTGQLRGYIYTYDKLNGINETSTDQKVNGGIMVAPGVVFRFGKLTLGALFDFGWVNKYGELYKDFEICLGYKF